MDHKLTQLKTILAEVSDLQSSASLLSWDQQTYMPPGGAQGRGHQLSTLETLAHLKFTSLEVGKLLDDLEPYARQLDPDSDDACLIRVTRRQYEKRTRVPAEMVAEFSQATTLAHEAWAQARSENNFALFQPHVEKIFDLRRQYADLFIPYDHVYDPLLDDYEPGMKTAEVKAIFTDLRPRQVRLVKAIADKPEINTTFLHQNFDQARQWDFGVEVITRFGYDWKRGRQDKSPHPFTQHFGIDDVRITTRIIPDFLNPALFGSMHETGHALYNQGVDHALDRTLIDHGASLAVHESQSRLWENLVGRSLPFWQHFYPRLQGYFPDQLGKISLEDFYRGINCVKPSLIRVEADEATYNLHVMLRLEIEIGLIEGSLRAKDLPEIWNSGMQEFLGVAPIDDAKGVLQDIHWSMGLIGYFPTYSLGNLISVQLWECILLDIPDLNDQIRDGEFEALLGWLREKIHRHGAKFEPQDLVKRATGTKIDPAPYMRYLQAKYGEIYSL